MNKISRRNFIQLTSLGMGALALEPLLSACAKATPLATPLLEADRASQPLTATAVQSAPEASSTAQEAGERPTDAPTAKPSETAARQDGALPYLAVARGGDPAELVRSALAALGGMERFVPKGARVMVKPNICVAYHTYEYAATTNPWVVGEVVRLALAAGARSVQVVDYPFGGGADEAYSRSGISEQVKAAGGEMVTIPSFKYVEVDLPAGRDLRSTKAFKDALEADVLINVPIAKHHGLARLTLGMKNLLGLIKERTPIHRNLGQRIADLTSLFQPDLTIVDAVRILMANGPSGGSLDDVRQVDTLIASADIVAADSYATSLFGLRPADIAYIPAAEAMGLGRSDLPNLKIEEITVGV